jgi:4-amino-4-deoxy-L-arabinose transferase-like glycosyltransferase
VPTLQVPDVQTTPVPAPIRRPETRPWPHPAGLAAGLVIAWVLFTLLVNTAQYGDHFEQFAWAQSFEWGYPKHPPLPSWLLAALNLLAGRQPAWPSLLSGVCLVLTAWFTWRLGERLLGADRAALALLLWGLQQGFASKSQLFNHNSVLVALVAATAWAALRASDVARQRQGWTWRWLLVGLGAGAAALAKYQAVVPLVGILVALGWSGALRQAPVWRGVLVAAVLALGVFAPHLAWVAAHHWSTVTYASQAGASLTLAERLASIGVFLVLQLRMGAPALLLLLVGLLWRRRAQVLGAQGDGLALGAAPSNNASAEQISTHQRERQAWLMGLVGVPALALLLTCLGGGLRLQDHWGIQSFQFLCLAVAALRTRAVLPQWRWWVGAALVLHGLWMLSYAAPRWQADASSSRTRVDQFFPAQVLADEVAQQWQRRTHCPLLAVRGPEFEAGLAAIYSGSQARIVELDLRYSPWLDAATLQRQGYMLVSLNGPPAWPDDLPAAQRDDRARGQLAFKVGGHGGRAGEVLHWAYVAPSQPCP